MNKITFVITEKEIERVAGRKIGRANANKILRAVENDVVLWSDIENSIKDAINQILL
ncbi:MAG: hypothetical protein Q7S83_02395 [bacterium]|nr:hypothetical protein [bacterium]